MSRRFARLFPLVAGLALCLAILAPRPARAQLPPSRYYGQATLNGQSAAGATIIGFIAGTNCGTATADSSGKYRLDVFASSQKPGCGQDGRTVTFTVNGANASETAPFKGGDVTPLNLTASSTAPSPVASTATATATAGGSATGGAAQNLVPQWLDRPLTTAAPQSKTCPPPNSWAFLYWGGPDSTQIAVAAATCPTADAYWSFRQGRWLGYTPSASAASDSWLVRIGDANFVRGH
jgi:hypothetical protein